MTTPRAVDWSAHEDLLADIFHTDTDAYPAGTPEYEDLRG